MAATIEVKYFNTFWVKKTVSRDFTPNGTSDVKVLPNFNGLPFYSYNAASASTRYLNFYDGSNSNTALKGDVNSVQSQNWFIEESRIKGDFNGVSTDYGVKAYIVNKDYVPRIRQNKVIYSGLFNSATNTNETNVFSEATNITFTCPPEYGSIQKLYASDTKLHIFQENKVSRAPVDKDMIYAADGQGTPVSTNTLVIGEINPYVGEYGISTNPESFDYFGNRIYFSDKNRNVVLRLSNDGLTEISQYGMADFFRDKLSEINSERRLIEITDTVDGQVPAVTNPPSYPPFTTPVPGQPYIFKTIAGPNDNYNNVPIGASIFINGKDTGLFVKAVNASGGTIETGGLCPFYFGPGSVLTLKYYAKDKIIGAYDVYNDNYLISLQKVDGTYHTLVFDEKSQGWVTFYDYKPILADSLFNRFYSTSGGFLWAHNSDFVPRNSFYGADAAKSSIEFIFNDQPSVVKVFKTINYEGTNGWEVATVESDQTGKIANPSGAWEDFTDTIAVIKSYNEGSYIEGGVTYRAGFDLKENRYVANVVNNTPAQVGEVIIGNQASGIKGYFTTVKIQTDNTTDPGGMKELFMVGSEFVPSSY